MMPACYPNQPRSSNNNPVPGCTGAPVPEDPGRLSGPEIGARVIYHDPLYPQWDGVEMVVIERSYVWSPEQHNRDGHGFRLYGSKVVGFDRDNNGPRKFTKMVVSDSKLSPTDERTGSLILSSGSCYHCGRTDLHEATCVWNTNSIRSTPEPTGRCKSPGCCGTY